MTSPPSHPALMPSYGAQFCTYNHSSSMQCESCTMGGKELPHNLKEHRPQTNAKTNQAGNLRLTSVCETLMAISQAGKSMLDTARGELTNNV